MASVAPWFPVFPPTPCCPCFIPKMVTASIPAALSNHLDTTSHPSHQGICRISKSRFWIVRDGNFAVSRWSFARWRSDMLKHGQNMSKWCPSQPRVICLGQVYHGTCAMIFHQQITGKIYKSSEFLAILALRHGVVSHLKLAGGGFGVWQWQDSTRTTGWDHGSQVSTFFRSVHTSVSFPFIQHI